jgi:hypothetical protein
MAIHIGGREFVIALGSASVAARGARPPLAMRRSSVSSAVYRGTLATPFVASFRRGVCEIDFVEDQNVV